jgi:ATP-binding cassette subfamily B protein
MKAEVKHHANGALGNHLVQSIRGVRTVKSLVLEARQRHRWDEYCGWVQRATLDLKRHDTFVKSVIKPVERFAVSGPLAIATYIAMTSGDADSIGALYMFAIIARQTVQPIVKLAESIEQWEDARDHIDAVGEVINRPDEDGRSGGGSIAPLQGHIRFSEVTFRYLGTRSPALEKVSFEVPAGTTLGIVGRSGSGKSTVTRLLQRLHPSYDGSITIDDIGIGEYDLDYLRGNLGVVLQENFLFTGTIRENITAARTNATYDEVVRAARLAGADEFIERLPRGFETHVYEGSSNLSGGQKQRIALARALITDPRILILDEATSALDPESEAIVNANLARMAHGRTLIVVSHRLSSLVKSDAILVLERGRVADIGRHEELLGRCDVYRHLWNQQNRHLTLTPARPAKPAARSPNLVS